ncbi:hypothetical protein [Ligilactobacillus salivarius]|uniref:hypothetical protein n=1 Tax=Ligilactobacillus salivarius TaxID=1624 RepID=UPI00254D76C4|nr:hypothetical protein [Ligilactobacillus salivarius]
MKELIINGMIIIGIAFMVVSCFACSMECEDKALELIENVGYVAIAIIICMIMIMVLSLVV